MKQTPETKKLSTKRQIETLLFYELFKEVFLFKGVVNWWEKGSKTKQTNEHKPVGMNLSMARQLN